MTTEILNRIINDSEFTDCIADAAPYRVKIIQDIAPRMKELQKEYYDLMVDVDYDDVSHILAKLKLDKKDENAKLDLATWRKKIMDIFRATLKSIHPNENQVPSIGMIYKAGKMLNFIGRNDIVESVLEDKNITINFKPLEEINQKFSNPDVKTKLTYIFQQADECQGEMCKNADMIKKDIYDRLPTSVMYNKDTNKKGLKPTHFGTLVRHKAMSIIKDADKYTKYISSQIDGTNANIDREEVILGKTKQM